MNNRWRAESNSRLSFSLYPFDSIHLFFYLSLQWAFENIAFLSEIHRFFLTPVVFSYLKPNWISRTSRTFRIDSVHWIFISKRSAQTSHKKDHWISLNQLVTLITNRITCFIIKIKKVKCTKNKTQWKTNAHFNVKIIKAMNFRGRLIQIIAFDRFYIGLFVRIQRNDWCIGIGTCGFFYIL